MLCAEIPEHPSHCIEDLAQQCRRELLPSTSHTGNRVRGVCLVSQMLLPSSMVAEGIPKGNYPAFMHFSWRMGRGLLLAVDVVLSLCMLQFPTTHRRIINVCVNQQTMQ